MLRDNCSTFALQNVTVNRFRYANITMLKLVSWNKMISQAAKDDRTTVSNRATKET